jgi:Zn-finger nucleic acid-binding protein
MKCPLCDVPMREVNRRGVQIDVCPECKGVWLDRGELEKLMEVSDQEEAAYERSRSRSRRDDDDDDDDDRRGRFFGSSGDRYFGSSGDRVRGRYEDDRRGYTQQRKKKSWFSQMMEAVGGEGAED